MNPRIYLSKQIERLRIETDGYVLCVYHKNYKPPKNSTWKYHVWEDFRDCSRESIKGVDLLIVVGLNRIMNPSNRTHLAFEVLFNNTLDLPKISIDRTLFVSDPWRSWFHFGLTQVPYRDYSYSYIAESQYNSYLESAREDDPFSIEELIKWGEKFIYCDYPKFGELEIQTKKMGDEVHREYQQLKEECFEQENTAKGVIRKLSQFAQEKYPMRKIPEKNRLFARDRSRIVQTDLKVDQWLVWELQYRMDLMNRIAEVCYGDGRIQTG